jgi:adenylate kinase
MAKQKYNLIIYGAPGSGKGTQGKLIAEKLKIFYFSTGDAFRSEIANGSKLGKDVEQILKGGHLVPDQIVIEIVKNTLKEKAKNGFILDGFPRTLIQAEALENLFKELKIADVKVINLEVDEAEVVKRLLSRAKIEGRADDTKEIIENRMKVYNNQTSPILDYYSTHEDLININGMGSVDEILERILSALK